VLFAIHFTRRGGVNVLRKVEFSNEPDVLSILKRRYRTCKGRPSRSFKLRSQRFPSSISLNVTRLDSIQSRLYHETTNVPLITRETRQVKSLVDLDVLEQKLRNEPSAASKLENRAMDLRAIKSLMGPVTALWSDVIIPTAREAKLDTSEMKSLMVYCERDIRATVKKDKRVGTGIAAYYLLSKDDSAKAVIGPVAERLDQIELPKTQWPQLVLMAMSIAGNVLGDTWISDLCARLLPSATRTTITWQRAANRRLSYLTPTRIRRFARELNMFVLKGGDIE